METVDLALFLHILTLLGAISLAGILHSAEWRSRSAQTVQELRVHARAFGWGKVFPGFILLLLVTGAWLVHLERAAFSYSTPWVWTAIVALVILGASGGLVLDRHAKAYSTLLAATPDGPVSPEVRGQALATVPWAVSHMNTALAIAVVFNMVNKPDRDIEAIGTLVVGIVVGTAIGLLGARDKG